MSAPTKVPVPPLGSGTGTVVPEPSGTAQNRYFETLAAFIERTRDLPPRRWLVDRLVPTEGRVLVVAAPNAGKTWLALVIAKLAAKAGRRVFLVLEEGAPKSTGDRFAALEIPPELPVEIAHLKGSLLQDRAVQRAWTGALKSDPSPVLVLDPFSSIFTGDENDTRAVNAAKAQLEALARVNPRALLVLLHHTSKAGERGEGAEMYAGRGSSILPGWADVQLNLSHEKPPPEGGEVRFVVRVVKDRDGERGTCIRLALSLSDGAVTFSEPERAENSDATGRIREVLVSAEGPLTKTEVVRRARGNRQAGFALLHRMEEAGEIEQEGSGYRLAQKGAL